MMGRGFGASRASGSGRGTARCHAGLPHALELMANAMRLVRMLYRHARGASRSAGVRGGVWTRESGGGRGRYATGGREERLSAAAVDAATAGRSARKGAERWWTDAGRVVRAKGARRALVRCRWAMEDGSEVSGGDGGEAQRQQWN